MEENWDNSDSPPYVPHVENKKIIRRVPPNLTKAQKRKFREEERQRWNRILAEENEADTKCPAKQEI